MVLQESEPYRPRPRPRPRPRQRKQDGRDRGKQYGRDRGRDRQRGRDRDRGRGTGKTEKKTLISKNVQKIRFLLHLSRGSRCGVDPSVVKCDLCACDQSMCCFWDSERLTEVHCACELGHGTAGRDLQATLLHKDEGQKAICQADFVLRGVSCVFLSNVCRSSTGIRQDSVQLLPLSAGQFFWSVDWFDSALIFGCAVRFYRIVFARCLFH